MIYSYFPVRLRKIIKKCMENCENIEEIRVRCGQNIVFCNRTGKWFLDCTGNFTSCSKDGIKLCKDEIKEMIKYFTQNSVYAMQQDIKNGFLTLEDGTRVGLCGRCVVKDGEIENINNISSFNIRLSRQIMGWGNELFEKYRVMNKNVLVIAPPGLGKTTLLRNMIKFASDDGKNVSVIDEKSEISPIADGNRIYDLGGNTDVMSDVSKQKGVDIVLRTMNPEIIAVDEILTKDDFETVKNAALSGIKIYATFHGCDEEDYLLKADGFVSDKLLFDCYIIICENDKNQRILKCVSREEL